MLSNGDCVSILGADSRHRGRAGLGYKRGMPRTVAGGRRTSRGPPTAITATAIGMACRNGMVNVCMVCQFCSCACRKTPLLCAGRQQACLRF